MTAVSDPPRTEFNLDALVREHQADVWRYLRYLGAAAADADDLTQETFLAIARTPFEIRNRAATAAYLRTAARNQLLMLRRRQGRQIATVDLAAAEAVWADHCPTGRSDGFLDALEVCRESLAGRTREAVNLFYRDNLSREELATRLEMTAEGVKTLLRRARSVLRQCIQRRLATLRHDE